MNEPVTVITTGRVTHDLELKTSQNGKNTKYVQFGFAVNKGYGENSHPNFYSCVVYNEAAQRMIDAKVKKEINSSFIFMSFLSISNYAQHLFFIWLIISRPRFTGSFSRFEISKKPSP